MNDELMFLAEDEAPPIGAPTNVAPPWKVLIIDDDEGVHSSTRFALERVRVDGRSLEITDVYSAEEAREHLKNNPDVALALVDVVMESDRAGLELVRWVRQEQGNQAIRLVLRTGQPGQAPERDVVVDYDIDDYKTKSELTSQKLFTLLHASLRSYRHIRALERNMAGLRRVIMASSNLYQMDSMAQFASGVLEQMTALLQLDPEAVYCETRGVATRSLSKGLEIVAATGEFSNTIGKDPYAALPTDVQGALAEALASRASVFRGHVCVSYCEARDGSIALMYLNAARDLRHDERDLIDLFVRNISMAFCGVICAERSKLEAANEAKNESTK